MGDFNWWLLIIGVVAGGLLTWLVLAESTRREREIGETELPAEAAWIARTLATPAVDAALAEEVLRAHRRYLGFPPPDVLVAPDDLGALDGHGVAIEPPAELVADDPAARPSVTVADDAQADAHEARPADEAPRA